MKLDFLTIYDLSKAQFISIINEAKRLRENNTVENILDGKNIALIFEKPSTRTRVSFEVGIQQLGGRSVVLSGNEIQLKRGESPADTARVLSRYVDAIMIRTFSHAALEELASFSDIPVMNGLSDLHHPCQVLADFQTIMQYGKDIHSLKMAFVGDGSSNVCHSLMQAASLMGIEFLVIAPENCKPSDRIMTQCKSRGGNIHFSPFLEQVTDCDVIYTDVWVSMGQEGLASEKKASLEKYGLTLDVFKRQKKDAIVMHCLPAHKGEEISEELFDMFSNVIFDQAENRLHAQKALIKYLFGALQ